MKKRWLTLSICLLWLLTFLTACGGSSQSNETAAADGASNSEGWFQTTDEAAPQDTSTPASQALQNAKIIRTGQMDLETQDFEETDAFVRTLTETQGGYLESTSVSGDPGSRYGSYTVRIPQEGYDTFFAQVGESCHVVSSSSQSQNITEQYVDLETRLSSLRTKHQRLLDLLAQADSMETIVALESELADTEYEIESLTGSLRQYDSLISFSTIDLSVREVSSLSPVSEGNSFFSELGQALKNGSHGVLSFLRGLILVCATIWPVLLLAAVVVVVIWQIRRRRKAKAQPPVLPPLDDTPADDSPEDPKA